MKTEYDKKFREFMPIALSVARSKPFFRFRRNGVECADIESDSMLNLHIFLKKHIDKHGFNNFPENKLLRKILFRDLLDTYKRGSKAPDCCEYEESASREEPIPAEFKIDFEDLVVKSGLSQVDKDILQMCIDGFKTHEIAVNYGVSDGAISAKKQKILRRLKKIAK